MQQSQEEELRSELHHLLVVAQMGHNVVDPSAQVEASLVQSLKDAGAAGAKIIAGRIALSGLRSRKPMGARYQRGTRELMRNP